MDGDLDTLLARLFDEGKQAFPEVTLAADAFARLAAPHVRSAPDGPPLQAGELLLACACAAADPAALRVFEERFLSPAIAAVARRERDPAAVDEVRQRVRERLLVAEPGSPPKIADYGGRGSLGGFVRVVAVRVHANLRRGDRPSEPLADAAAPLAEQDPELELIRARYQGAFDQALRDALAELPARDRGLLRMHFLKGLGIDQLGLVFQVHRATAARWLQAARERLLDATSRKLRDRLGVSPSELESLVGLVRSRLDVSLHGLFGDDPPDAG